MIERISIVRKLIELNQKQLEHDQLILESSSYNSAQWLVYRQAVESDKRTIERYENELKQLENQS